MYLLVGLQRKKHPGHLNYVISKLCNGFLTDRHSYTNFNEVVGVLECAKQELIRRLLVPYEKDKCFENGEVYDI